MQQNEPSRLAVLLLACLGIVEDDFGEVIEDELDEALSHVSRVVHGRRRVDLDEPHFQVFVDHEIIPQEFEGIFAGLHHVLDRFQRTHDLPLKLGPYHVLENVFPLWTTICFHEMITEFVTRPHVPFNFAFFELFRLRNHSVIREMHVLVRDLLDVIVDRRETHVALPVNPDGQGIPVGHEHPLTDVEFFAQDKHGVLYVLLDDPLSGVDLPDVLHHLFVAAETLNATASRFTSWFQDPSVAMTIDVILWVL